MYDSLAALKLISNCFVKSKMIKKRFTVLYTDENMLYFNEDSGNVVFSCNEMGIRNIDLNSIDLDNIFLMKMILILLFLSDFWNGILNLENAKHLKKVKINANSVTS